MIDVQVVAYGDGPMLRSALGSARRIEGARLLVVDHRGDVADDLDADVVIVDTSNPGFGAGHNRLLQHGTAPWVLLLNPDSTIDGDGIAIGVRELESEPRIAAVQGIVRRSDGGVDRSAGIELTAVHLLGRALRLRGLLRVSPVRWLVSGTALLGDHAARIRSESSDVAVLAATAVLVRRAALEDVEGFDPAYFLYGEDLDLCRRLRARGWRLRTLPVAWADHAEGSTSSNSWERELRWWEGTLQFAAQWWTWPRWLLGELAAVVVALRLLIRRPSAPLRVGLALFGRPTRVALRRWRASAPAPPSPSPSSRRRR